MRLILKISFRRFKSRFGQKTRFKTQIGNISFRYGDFQLDRHLEASVRARTEEPRRILASQAARRFPANQQPPIESEQSINQTESSRDLTANEPSEIIDRKLFAY